MEWKKPTRVKNCVKVIGLVALITQSISLTAYASDNVTYTVKQNDTLWKIGQSQNVSVDSLRAWNQLTSDSIYPNQVLFVKNVTKHNVQAGETLWRISQNYSVSVAKIKEMNQLTSDVVNIGQVLIIPAKEEQTNEKVHTVQQGDTLWIIARLYNTTVSNIKLANNLTSDSIFVGQRLSITSNADSTQSTPAPTNTSNTTTSPTITTIIHTVVSGDNIWSLSIKYGIPQAELLKANNFTTSTVLSIGQKIKVPVHNIPVKETQGPSYGEFLDWWTEAQYVFPINKIASVKDIKTGKTFNIKRTIGAYHADCEPLTSADAAIIKNVWGGAYSWNTRAVLVMVDGRQIAASMASMGHDVDYIANNSFTGHFDLHFLNSTRHKDNTIDPNHQANVKLAAGIK